MSEWHRAHEVNWLGRALRVALFLVVLLLCFNGAPFAFGIPRDPWRPLLNPVIDVFLLATLVLGWLRAKAGIYVGAAGVMARVGRRRIVVPWHEIAYAEVGEVPNYPLIMQRAASLGLVLVAPSGQRRPLPARLVSMPALRWGRGAPPYVVLSRERMIQVVDHINMLVTPYRPQAWPPPDQRLSPPR